MAAREPQLWRTLHSHGIRRVPSCMTRTGVPAGLAGLFLAFSRARALLGDSASMIQRRLGTPDCKPAAGHAHQRTAKEPKPWLKARLHRPLAGAHGPSSALIALRFAGKREQLEVALPLSVEVGWAIWLPRAMCGACKSQPRRRRASKTPAVVGRAQSELFHHLGSR